MIAALWGTVRDKSENAAVIECHGVGYGVDMPTSSLAQLGEIGNDAHVFVHTHVAEDQLRLFAFLSRQERDVFVTLIGTAGVGPKLALMMLSVLDADGIWQAVENKDRHALLRVPGVGGKKADRLLVDLKGRLPMSTMNPSVPRRTPNVSVAHSTENEVEGALLHLGFAAQQASAAAQDAIAHAGQGADVATLIRHALRQLTHLPQTHRAKGTS